MKRLISDINQIELLTNKFQLVDYDLDNWTKKYLDNDNNETWLLYYVDGVPKIKWSESWNFSKGTYMGYEFLGFSTDLCVMKWSTTASKYVWESVSNTSYYTAGVRPEGTEFVKDGYADNYYGTYAEVQLTSHINFINGGPRSTTPKSRFHKFYHREE